MSMNEKERDRLLRIHTRNSGERAMQSIHYHHYEATSYWMLDELFSQYEVDKESTFVDFGCGKGRLLFYVHHYFQVSVVGVEMNDQLYRQALSNEASYLQHKKKNKTPIRIEHQFAERYQVEQEEGTFFLFNPFSLEIFTKVIHNILRSVEESPRTVDVILYYPAVEYMEFLETNTPFRLWKEVDIPRLSKINQREKFSIYRYVTES